MISVCLGAVMCQNFTSELTLSPVMTRVGGLPANAVDPLIPDIAGLVSDLHRTDSAIAASIPPLVDFLFKIVPQLDTDIALRRKVLAAKRDVNGCRAPNWAPSLPERLVECIGTEALLIVGWEEKWRRRTAQIKALECALAEHRTNVVRHLLQTFDDPQFRDSLALAAPDFLRYGKVQNGKKLNARNLQTLYSYVTRAALKTSPFSGLTTVGLAGSRGSSAVRSQSSVTVGYLALLRMARDPDTASLLTYRTAPVRRGGPNEPSGLMLHSEMMIAGGIAWRQDRVVEADHAIRWLSRLPANDRGELTFAAIIAAVGGIDPFLRFQRLLDSGILRPVPPWRCAESPLAALAALVPESLSEIIGVDLARAHRWGEAVADQEVAMRLQATIDVGRLASAWTNDADVGTLPSGLIYEDRETDCALLDLRSIPSMHDDLASYAEIIRPWIFRSHIYDFLVERFVAEFGVGGVCVDPLRFLMLLSVDRDSNPGLDRAFRADLLSRGAPQDRANLPVGLTSAAPNAGILYQVDVENEIALHAGRYRMVINHYSSGTGGLFARFATLLGPRFRHQLRDYVARCWQGTSVRQLNIWTDCNTVQAECAGLMPPLLLPGEPSHPDGLAFVDTALAHDPATDTLSLFDPRGNVVGLGYFGLIPQHLLQSYVRLLAILADPWVNASPHTDYTLTNSQELAANSGESIRFLDRKEVGRLVVRRRSWVVPVSALPLTASNRTDAELVLDMARFREEHGIPAQVFVHQLGNAGFDMLGVRKPMWVALDSPVALDVFQSWLRPTTTHLRLVEVLPGRSGRYLLDSTGKQRTSEHAVLLCWRRSGGVDDAVE